jgi:hypothetical protein
MSDAAMPAEMAESVLGHRLAFLLAQFRSGGDGASDADLALHFRSELPAPPIPVRRMLLGHFARALKGFVIRAYEQPTARLAVKISPGRHLSSA